MREALRRTCTLRREVARQQTDTSLSSVCKKPADRFSQSSSWMLALQAESGRLAIPDILTISNPALTSIYALTHSECALRC